MKNLCVVDTVIGAIAGIGITISLVLVILINVPSAYDVVNGRVWLEYTSDGNSHWVWKK